MTDEEILSEIIGKQRTLGDALRLAMQKARADERKKILDELEKLIKDDEMKLRCEGLEFAITIIHNMR